MIEESLESVKAELERQSRVSKNLADIYHESFNLHREAQNEIARLKERVSERQFIIDHLQDDVAMLKQYIGDLRYFTPQAEVAR